MLPSRAARFVSVSCDGLASQLAQESDPSLIYRWVGAVVGTVGVPLAGALMMRMMIERFDLLVDDDKEYTLDCSTPIGAIERYCQNM